MSGITQGSRTSPVKTLRKRRPLRWSSKAAISPIQNLKKTAIVAYWTVIQTEERNCRFSQRRS